MDIGGRDYGDIGTALGSLLGHVGAGISQGGALKKLLSQEGSPQEQAALLSVLPEPMQRQLEGMQRSQQASALAQNALQGRDPQSGEGIMSLFQTLGNEGEEVNVEGVQTPRGEALVAQARPTASERLASAKTRAAELKQAYADVKSADPNNPNLPALALRQRQAQEEVSRLQGDAEDERAERKVATQQRTGLGTKAVEKFEKEYDNYKGQESAYRDMDRAIRSRDFSLLSRDGLAEVMETSGIPGIRDWGKSLKTGDARELENSVKNFFIATLGEVSARGVNQWIERVIRSMSPQIGNSQEANRVLGQIIKTRLDAQKLKLDAQQKYLDKEEESGRPISRAFLRQGEREAQPAMDAVRDIGQMKIQAIMEESKTDEELLNPKKSETKGNVLTPRRARLMAQKYGSPERARQVAEAMGFVIYDGPQYEEYFMEEE